jgi:hypothetical protein
MQNSFSMKANRLSTKKRDLRMNLRDVLIAEEQENSRGMTTEAAVAEEASAAAATGGKPKTKESLGSLFFMRASSEAGRLG